MIDLSVKALPNTVEVDGKAFSIYTDFRVWIRFERDLKAILRGKFVNLEYLFMNEYPVQMGAREINEVIAFAHPKMELPRPIGMTTDAIVIDYDIDAELIYSAFLQQYGIDLLTANMHWHVFIALIRGLTDATKMGQIMGYRCYKKDTRKNRDAYDELRRAWMIYPPVSDEEQSEIEEFESQFV